MTEEFKDARPEPKRAPTYADEVDRVRRQVDALGGHGNALASRILCTIDDLLKTLKEIG